MACLGFEPGQTEWKAQTIPLSYDFCTTSKYVDYYKKTT